MTGYIHSIYNGGMVDGLGIRSVVFLSGCPLRCLYCHNPDSWVKTSGERRTVDDVVSEIQMYTTFHKASGGGVTFTGGEPFMQAKFLTELLRACKEKDIHTAVDTSGHTKLENAKHALPYTDLLLLDVKSINPTIYKKITGANINPVLDMLRLSFELNIPTWVRYVLLPGLTDDIDDIKALAEYLRPFKNVKKVDVLPFHKVGEYKWHEHKLDYKLSETLPPSKELLETVREILNLSR
ncbi:MAG: pyruvate formate-lyase-activating protein [Oscillospiraceae bacterium]|nr:pyruvate formate-lyase-activating protein [Oscillospiraceae bacterium]